MNARRTLETFRPMLDRRDFILMGMAGLGLSACSRPPEGIIGVESPTRPPASVPGVKQHDLFVATTRALDPNPAILFSGERGDRLQLARMTVTVPPGHVPGKVERPKELPPDPATDFTVSRAALFPSDAAFTADIRRALLARKPADRSVLFFVHGYNTTLTAAVLRLGQFVQDTGYTGVPVLFSWASRGKLQSYVYDINSVLAARDDLLRAATLISPANPIAVDVVAHSMGNLLTVEAMRQAKLEGTYNRRGLIRNVILASPDIDADLFARQVSVFPKNERHFFVFVSKNDRALGVSRRIAGGVSRVGAEDAGKLSELGVTVIDLTEINDTSSLNHSKFTDSPEIVQLIGNALDSLGPLETSSTRNSLIAEVALLPVTVVTSVGQVINGE